LLKTEQVAEPLLIDGYKGMKHRQNSIPHADQVHVQKAIDRLIELYQATEKPDEVKKWTEEKSLVEKQHDAADK